MATVILKRVPQTIHVCHSPNAYRFLSTLRDTPRGNGLRINSNRGSPPPSRQPVSVQQYQSPQRATTTTSQRPADYADEDNTLLTPINIPEDKNGILQRDHPAASILGNSALVIQRQLELGNILLGFEQANKYVIMDPMGNHIGFMAEKEGNIGNLFTRQLFRTRRAFTTHVFDKHEREVLRFHRPFAWINSRISVYDPLDSQHNPNPDQTTFRTIGEAQASWHLIRRRYNLFLHHSPPTPTLSSNAALSSNNDEKDSPLPQASPTSKTFSQFAYINEPFLSWDFSLLSASDTLIGSVNRDFAGLGRELFTDTGVYALRMDAAAMNEEPDHVISKTAKEKEFANVSRGMTLDERAVMLATAVSVDFDYFSRHSGGGGGEGGFLGLAWLWALFAD